jgi:hypothetical protein
LHEARSEIENRRLMAPYRDAPPGSPAAAQRPIVKGRRKLKVIEHADGSSRIYVGTRASAILIIAMALLSMFFAVAALGLLTFSPATSNSVDSSGVQILVATIAIVGAILFIRTLLWLVVGGEDFAVSAAAFVWKRRFTPWRGTICHLTSDVSTIVIAGEKEGGRLLVQLGRQAVEICGGLGLDDADRREVARVLRSALSRAAGVDRVERG